MPVKPGRYSPFSKIPRLIPAEIKLDELTHVEDAVYTSRSLSDLLVQAEGDTLDMV